MLVTYTGKQVDYNNITKEMIDIRDIIHTLPRLNRFVGHSSRAYSVGEHTYYCLMMAKKLGYSKREQFLTFIHDFTETYVGDCPSPLKRLLPKFEEIEANVENAICAYLEIEPPTEEEYKKVKRIDMTMLVIEMRDLTLHKHESFINDWTYEEMLNDKDFKISKNIIFEGIIVKLLETSFESLYKEMLTDEKI